MINKRGVSYVDWTISIGIFLVAVITLFVFIRPGIAPAHTAQTLVTILEEEFYKETGWTVKQTPLYVRTLQPASGGFPVELRINILGNDWRFDNTITGTRINVAGFPASTYLCNNVPCDAPTPASINTQAIIQCAPSTATVCQDTKFILSYYQTGPTPSQLALVISDPSSADADLGSTEIFTGISPIKQSALRIQNYEDVKQAWNFPTQRDFAVRIDNDLITGTDIPQQTNVHAKEIKDWRLYPNGTQFPITINLQVW